MGPAGPQGEQGIQGPPGTYTAGAGITINNNEISVNSATITQGVRVGFASSTTWTCPTGVTQIKVEVWGAGGGGATGSLGKNNLQCGVLIGNTYHGEHGGSGGNGGYNSAIIQVIPGQSYLITIGQGGIGASGFSQGCPSFGNNGGNGGATLFSNIISASGGLGGSRGESYNNFNSGSNNNYSSGPSGQNAPINNYNYPVINYGNRSYIPISYLSAIPGNSALGGSGGQRGYDNGSNAFYPPNASNGEDGYCVISY
jgi:hypothetical protein